MGELEDLRHEVDEVDEALLELIKERQRLAKKIGRIKREKSAPALDKARWEIVLKQRKSMAKRLNMPVKQIVNIWNLLHTMAIIEEEKHGR